MASKAGPGTYIGAIILAIIFFIPLWVLILIAFEPVRFTFGRVYPSFLPLGFTLKNIITSITTPGLYLGSSLLRSLEVAFMVGGIAIFLSIFAGYGLSKLTARVSNKIIVLLFLINMMPGLIISIPVASEFDKVGLYNNIVGVALAQELVVLPLSVFIVLGGFRGLPKDLENQARVDGAPFFTSFFRIILPLNRIAIMVAFLLSWMTSWDEFTYAVIIDPIAPSNSTFPVTLYNYVSRDLALDAATFALVATVPVLILTGFLMKYLKGQYLSGGMVV
ncbi:MAG: carbohydrate ABC transporter permease [Candidatus Thermoplasmatota archaeon]|nr:carbohydrate ABC transporter permease [Candidatus Thermoplasmatota archaeon]